MKIISTKKIAKQYLILLALPLCMFLLSNSSGRATQASEGNTGSPGDQSQFNKTCMTCHGTGLQLTNSISVIDANGDEVTAYTPGETYTVSVSLSSTGNPSSYGFQLVGELDNTETVNGFSNPSSNAKLVNLGNRQYAEQNGPSSTSQFSVEWTAPATDAGTVTFYSAGIGANGNGMSSGDGGALGSFELASGATSNKELSRTAINVYPNPSTEYIRLEATEINNLNIYASNGQLILQVEEVSNNEIRVADFQQGLYFIQFESENKLFTSKFVKN